LIVQFTIAFFDRHLRHLERTDSLDGARRRLESYRARER
jgi:hypothetical protein